MRTTSFLQRGTGALAALCTALLLAAPAWANHEDDDDEAVDPPARVGRISALRGSVDSSPEPGAAWEAAKINQPVTGRTALWVTPGSQAEVRIGSGSVRFDGNTQAVFSQLDDHGIALDVAQGTVRARVRNLPSGDRFTLSADGVRAEVQGPGDYRVSYNPDRRAYTVRTIAGRLRIVTPSTSLNLEAGQEGLIEDGGQSLHVGRLGEFDAFDAWAEARDREQDRLASARYVSPETTGIEALDEHGRWAQVTDYGPVWYPRVAVAGWAPYRYGHWAWVRPWGWTWIDDAPWGFAPFHYGRWALIGGSWGWVPGPIVHRPVWAPALVGYVGRPGLSVSIGIGAPIGWFPLGPREYYHPPYRYSPRYGNRINFADAPHHAVGTPDQRRVTRQPLPQSPVYRYAQRPEAVTVVSEDNFRSARPIGRERVPLTPQQVARLQPAAAAMPGPRSHPDVPAPAAGPRGAVAGLPVTVLPAPTPTREANTGRGERARPWPAQAQPAERPQHGSVRAPVVPEARAAVPTNPAPALPPPRAVQVPSQPQAHPQAEVQERFDQRRSRVERDEQQRGHSGHERRIVAPHPAAVERPTMPAAPALSTQVLPAPQVIPPPVPVPRVLPAPQVIPPPRAIPAPSPQVVMRPQPPAPVMQAPAPPPQGHMPAPPQQARQAQPGWGQQRGDGPRGDGPGSRGEGPRGENPRGARFER